MFAYVEMSTFAGSLWLAYLAASASTTPAHMTRMNATATALKRSFSPGAGADVGWGNDLLLQQSA